MSSKAYMISEDSLEAYRMGMRSLYECRKQLTAATKAREEAEKRAEALNKSLNEANDAYTDLEDKCDSLTEANAGLVEDNKRLRENAGLDAERWLMVELIRKKEGKSVEIVYDNPDFGGPNSLVIVRDCMDGSEVRHTGDDITDALRKAIAAQQKGVDKAVEEAATKAKKSGDRGDLLRYLRLRRTR